MAGQLPTYSPQEIARRGDEIYEQRVRPQVESSQRGKVVAIDVHTGDYALGDTAVQAADSLRLRQPRAEVWFVRVGHRALYRLGYSRPAEDQ